jgi:hypothetical protein
VRATSDGPRIEDFGITPEDLSRAPCLFLANHRPAVLVAAYSIVAVVLFVLILGVSGSYLAGAFFAVIALAAGSVLLLPVLILVQCAGEKVEERWLCRRFPMLRACLAYQNALAHHTRLKAARAPQNLTHEQWSEVSLPTLIRLVEARLDTTPGFTISRVDRESTGVDFTAKSGNQNVLIRCESGSKPISASVGREIAAALSDLGAENALIFSVAGPTPALKRYLADRPIKVLAPWDFQKAVPGA